MKKNPNKTQPNNPPKLVSFVGRSNSGKTTLLTKLIPLFKKLNLTVGTIKNTHHDVNFDKPGKDSWKYAQSGSDRVLVSSGNRIAVFSESSENRSLNQLVNQWFLGFDLVISEGFKNEECFKIEVVRSANKKEPLYKDPVFKINGIVSDLQPSSNIPCFSFEDLDMLVKWICDSLHLKLD